MNNKSVRTMVFVSFFILALSICLASCEKDEVSDESTAIVAASTEVHTIPQYTQRKVLTTKEETTYEYQAVISPTKTDDGYEIIVKGGDKNGIAEENVGQYSDDYQKPYAGEIVIE